MYSRIARTIATKKVVYTLAGTAAVYAYAQQCKNDVVFFTRNSK